MNDPSLIRRSSFSEQKQLELIRSAIDIHRNLREKFSTIDALQSPDKTWTTEELLQKIQTMVSGYSRSDCVDDCSS